MANIKIEHRVEAIIKQLESNGRIVHRVKIDGRIIDITFRVNEDEELGFIDFGAKK